MVTAVRADPASAHASRAIRVRNLEEERFPSRDVDVDTFVVDGSSHDWANYFLAAHKVLFLVIWLLNGSF